MKQRNNFHLQIKPCIYLVSQVHISVQAQTTRTVQKQPLCKKKEKRNTNEYYFVDKKNQAVKRWFKGEKQTLDSGLIATSFNTVYSDGEKRKQLQKHKTCREEDEEEAVKTGKRIKEYKKVIFQIPRKRKRKHEKHIRKEEGLSTTDKTWKN